MDLEELEFINYKVLTTDCAADIPFDTFTNETFSDTTSSELAFSSIVDSTASHSPQNPPVLDGFLAKGGQEIDLNALLSQPMYDDVEDPSHWSSLFEKTTSPVLSKRPAVMAPPPFRAVASRGSPCRPLSEHKSQKPARLEKESSTARRNRNTLAARKSREKKRERLTDLENRLAELERLNTQLNVENKMLRQFNSLPPRKD